MTVEGYINDLRMKGRKEKSCHAYEIILGRCLKVLREGGRSVDPAEIVEDDVRWLVAHLPLCENSKKHYAWLLGKWAQWETGRNPFAEANILWNKSERNRHFIDKEILDHALSVSDERERLILLLGAKMGLRRMEIASVRLSDIKDGRLTVFGKGHGCGKEAHCTIHPDVAKAIEAYMCVRDKQDPDRLIDTLILSRRGMRAKAEDISYAMTLIESRIGEHITPHSLRRLFATTLYEDVGADILDVSKLMRHNSVSTTQIYIRSNQNRLDNLLAQI